MFDKDLFGQLKEEHSEVKSLFKKAENCEESKRSEILDEIQENLVPHARGEEKTLYAIMREQAKDSDKEESLNLANEAYEEHRVADSLLAELKKLDPSDEKWLAHLKVLKENVEHHIEEEEDELFSKAKKLVASEDQDALLKVYLKEKERFSEGLPTQSQINERTVAEALRH